MKRSLRALAGGAAVLACLAVLAGVALAAPPDIDITPSSSPSNRQALGTVCVGSTSKKTFTITNKADGGPPLTIGSVTRTEGPASFSNTSPTSTTLDPQASATFDVLYTPTFSQKGADATFTVSSNDPDQATVKVYVTATGIDRLLSSDRSAVSFGDQRVGTRSPKQTLIVRNSGQDVVTVSDVKRGGANGADFRVSGLPQERPFSIAPGDILQLTVAFQPSGAGLRKGALEFTSDACDKPKLAVSLVGTGVVPAVAVEPNPIDVGLAPRDSQGPPTAVTVSNAGGAPLKITAVQVLGTDAADFQLTGLPVMPTTLPPGESFIFSVRMTPGSEGPRVASINVLSDDPAAPTFSVPLQGIGASPSPSPSPSASATPTRSPSASPTAAAQGPGGTPNDSLAVGVVITVVLLAFAGLFVVRRFIRPLED